MELQPFYDAPGLGGGEALGEALLEGSGAVGVQIVQDHPDRLDLRVGLVHQPAHLMGEVLHRAAPGHRHMPPACQRLASQEQVARTLPAVLVVLTPWPSRLRRERRPRLRQQLGGGLVKADYRPAGVMGFLVQVQDVFHAGYKVGAHLGNAPLLLPPRYEGVFLRRLRIPSWDIEGANPNSTTFPANRRRVQWPCPSGAGLQAKVCPPATTGGR